LAATPVVVGDLIFLSAQYGPGAGVLPEQIYLDYSHDRLAPFDFPVARIKGGLDAPRRSRTRHRRRGRATRR